MQMDMKYSVGGYSLENIRNKNELKVIEVIKDVLPHFPGFCGCNVCIEDVYAATLNSLEPRYQHHLTIVLKGKSISSEEIEKQVKFFVEKVMENPNHP